MQRLTLLSIILAAGACARQPICKPWAPASAAGATAEGATVAPPDDGTTQLAAADTDDAWTSVVGAGPAAADRADAADAHAAHKPRPRRVAKAEPKPATPKPAPAAAAPAAGAAPPAAKPAPNPKLAEAKQFYAGRCVPCHGPAGRGDGPTGLALDPHPRNFTDRAWQKSVTDIHIEKVILQGGPSVGKSPLMPPHGDLSGKPELLAAMREVVRGFGR